MKIIRFKKLTLLAVDPIKKFNVDAGFDLTATWKREEDNYIEYGTDIAFEIPEGMVGLIFPRSSITDKSLMLKNSTGVIDASYRGEIKFRFYDTKPTEYGQNQYYIGERIGQIVFLDLPAVSLREVEELSDTERGTGGYGSTNKQI
jgi:dUTP pyrophosphatase